MAVAAAESTVLAASHRQRVQQLWSEYDASISTGQFVPFGYPFGLLATLVPFVYLLLPRTRFSTWGRLSVWLFIVFISIYTILHARARNASTSYFVGLIHAWLALWSFAHFVVNDAKGQYARIKLYTGSEHGQRAVVSQMSSREAASQTKGRAVRSAGSESCRQRIQVESFSGPADGPAKISASASHRTYAWQQFPETVTERAAWAYDLITSHDGSGWTWAIPTLPPVPNDIQCQSDRPHRRPSTRSIIPTRRCYTRPQLWRAALRRLILCYIVIDIVKAFTSHDPYFWSQVDHPGPEYLGWVRTYPSLVRAQRILIVFTAIYCSIQYGFAHLPLIAVYLLGEERIGGRAEPWHYPDAFGSLSAVLDRGLVGFWGEWWHQAFRFVLETPTNGTIRFLRLDPTATSTRVFRLFLVFSLSGFLHACGSHTAVGNSHPITGSFIFFFVQPFGLGAQLLVESISRRSGLSESIPRWVRRAASVLFVCCWFYYTVPPFFDDLAHCGTFTYDPLPISITRGLGFGGADDTLWAWHGRSWSWNTEGHWLHWGIVS